MHEYAAFDVLAPGYDQHFGHSLTGQAQRAASRQWLLQFLRGKGSLRILEINCGTGDDAWWLTSLGHQVVATDQSPGMIYEAQSKQAGRYGAAPRFLVCPFSNLDQLASHDRFDLVFSNFAGLNCIAAPQLLQLAHSLQQLLHEDGHIAVVIFGKYCWWETAYYLLKADGRRAFRRWSDQPHFAQLSDTVYQQVFYHSVRQFARCLPRFRQVAQRPVGLFLPPSYLEGSMRKHRWLFGLLWRLDKLCRRLPVCSPLADHIYLLFKKHVA